MYFIADNFLQQYLTVNKCKFRGVKLAVLICRAMM